LGSLLGRLSKFEEHGRIQLGGLTMHTLVDIERGKLFFVDALLVVEAH